jgi:hypothetical protein
LHERREKQDGSKNKQRHKDSHPVDGAGCAGLGDSGMCSRSYANDCTGGGGGCGYKRSGGYGSAC